MGRNPEIHTVTSLNQRIKLTLESDPDFVEIYLSGEISNFKSYPNGHCYFTLKDESSAINGAIWATYAKRLRFRPKDGDKVVCFGSLNVYVPRGNYTFIATSIEFEGQGDELAKLRALAEKLKAEGLFDESRKQKIPAFPKRIGVIAGKDSAGMKDILHNISLRYPLVELFAIPSIVQGEKAPKDLIRALHLAETLDLDTLIIGRGGGSSEDLWAFNDEELVRAVAATKIPVISAVGHEVDTTLIDLVADKRVSTPTGAAVAATPNKDDLLMALSDDQNALINAINAILRRKTEKLELLSNRAFFANPGAIYAPWIEKMARYDELLSLRIGALLAYKESKLENLKGKLNSLNPENVLKRGYAISHNAKGKVVSSVDDVKEGEEIITHLKDGVIKSSVKEKARR